MLLSLRRGAPPLLPSASGPDLRDPGVARYLQPDGRGGLALAVGCGPVRSRVRQQIAMRDERAEAS